MKTVQSGRLAAHRSPIMVHAIVEMGHRLCGNLHLAALEDDALWSSQAVTGVGRRRAGTSHAGMTS